MLQLVVNTMLTFLVISNCEIPLEITDLTKLMKAITTAAVFAAPAV